jgi:hypothetical protein
MLLIATTPVEIVGALGQLLAMGKRPATVELSRAAGTMQRLLEGHLPVASAPR